MLKDQDILDLLKRLNVLREGHFHLTSGRHSDRFLLCSQLTMYPQETKKIMQELAQRVRDAGLNPTVIVGPAMGGVILAYELASCLGECRAIFTEKEGDGMSLKRGFELKDDDRILVVEDAVSTGGSVQKAIDCLKDKPGELIGVAILFDRTKGKVNFGVPLVSLMDIEITSWDPAECPLCKTQEPLIFPKA